MRKKSTLLFIISICLNFSSIAQTEVEKLITLSQDVYNFGAVEQAYETISLALIKDSNNIEANYLAGKYLMELRLGENALIHFLKVYNINKNYSDNIELLLAQCFHLSNSFDNAINLYSKQINKYISSEKSKENLNQINNLIVRISQCNIGKKLIENPVKILVENLGNNINSDYPDYTPSVTSDNKTMIFTSRREGSTGGYFDMDNLSYEDIYISYKNNNGVWSKAENIGSPINNKYHDASINISPDGNKIYVYSDENMGDIKVSNKSDNGWSEPKSLKLVNSANKEYHITTDEEENIIIFSSDRPESKGRIDLFILRKNTNGKWSDISTIDELNTEYNEDSPYLTPDGNTLYFSSDGINSMGGFDIFKSTYNKVTNKWSSPVNLGYPLNTSYDEIYFSYSEINNIGYFSARRGFKENDIYSFKFLQDYKAPILSDVVITNPIIVKETFKISEKNNIEKVNSFTALIEEAISINKINDADITKKKELILNEKLLLKEKWKNAKTKEDSLLLYAAEQQLQSAEKSLNLLEEKLVQSKSIADKNKQLLNQELQKSNAIKLKNQIMFWGILISSVLLILAIYFLFLSRKLNKKVKATLIQVEETNEELQQTNEEILSQRDQIEEQKHIIEHTLNEVTASINYAERIQKALLDNKEHWEKISSEFFILFKPRDIVSGDFYWAHTSGDFAIWVAADCTGHGVPGAFMSMLGISFLNEIVADGGEKDPGKILDKLRNKIIKSLEQKSSEDERKDGMDIALCVWNKSTNVLQYSGANNPLVIIRKNAENEASLIELKPDKMPIGNHILDNTPFTTKEIGLQKGDIIYSFTDGFQDQFGGTEDKKFMVKNMKQLFLNQYEISLNNQKELLNHEFENWIKIGSSEQTDDVCIIGVKVK